MRAAALSFNRLVRGQHLQGVEEPAHLVEGGRPGANPCLSEGRSTVTIATSNRSPLTAQIGDPFPVLICGVPQIGVCVWRPVALCMKRRWAEGAELTIDLLPRSTYAVRAPDLIGYERTRRTLPGRTATGGVYPSRCWSRSRIIWSASR